MAAKGFRVLGVASAIHPGGEWPAEQDDFAWRFEGLVSLQDPPRQNAREVIAALYRAGIEVKLITETILQLPAISRAKWVSANWIMLRPAMP